MGLHMYNPPGIPCRPELIIYGSHAAKFDNRNATEFAVLPMVLANSITSFVVWFRLSNGNLRSSARVTTSSSLDHSLF